MASSSGLAPSWLENSLGSAPSRGSRVSGRSSGNNNGSGTSASPGSPVGANTGSYSNSSHRTHVHNSHTRSGSNNGGGYGQRTLRSSPPHHGYRSGQTGSTNFSGSHHGHGRQGFDSSRPSSNPRPVPQSSKPTFEDQFPSLGSGSPSTRGDFGRSAWAGTNKSASPPNMDGRRGPGNTSPGDRKKIQMVSRNITHLHTRSGRAPTSRTITSGSLSNSNSGSDRSVGFGKPVRATVSKPSSGRTTSGGRSNSGGSRPSSNAARNSNDPLGGAPPRNTSITESVRGNGRPSASTTNQSPETVPKRSAKKSIMDIGFMDLSGGATKAPTQSDLSTPNSELSSDVLDSAGGQPVPSSASHADGLSLMTGRSPPSEPIGISSPRVNRPEFSLLPSGSIEKEERLLREMGWGAENEDDENDEGAGLTQEEIDEVLSQRNTFKAAQSKPKLVLQPTTPWLTPSLNSGADDGDDDTDDTSDEDD